MFDKNDLMDFMEEDLPLDEPADVLRTMPEIREWVGPDRHDDELGLRSLLERPEALSSAWWHSAHAKRPLRTSKSLKRHTGVRRAA